MSEGGYIQGAGDDSEGWAHGLTPPVFWKNKATLFGTDEDDLPGVISDLMANAGQGIAQRATLISPTRNLYISPTDGVNAYDLMIDCHGDPAVESPKRLNLGCRRSKLGSRDLRQALAKVQDFVRAHLTTDPSPSLLVTCESGKDLSAGTLLAIICLFYGDNGNTPPRSRLS